MEEYNCNFKPFTTTRCMGMHQLLTSLNHAPVDPNRYTLQTSYVILSRISMNYLLPNFDDWVICGGHVDELLSNYKAKHSCSHFGHRFNTSDCTKMSTVTYAMSKTLLKKDSIVLPIGANICLNCKREYERRSIPGLNSIKSTKDMSDSLTEDDSIADNYDSIAANDDSIAANDDSIAANDDSIAEEDEPVTQVDVKPDIKPIMLFSPSVNGDEERVDSDEAEDKTDEVDEKATASDDVTVNKNRESFLSRKSTPPTTCSSTTVIASPKIILVKNLQVGNGMPASTSSNQPPAGSIPGVGSISGTARIIRPSPGARFIRPISLANIQTIQTSSLKVRPIMLPKGLKPVPLSQIRAMGALRPQIQASKDSESAVVTEASNITAVKKEVDSISDDKSSSEQTRNDLDNDEVFQQMKKSFKAFNDTNNTDTSKKEDEFKSYCELCHIGFLKESSYIHHMQSNQEKHNKLQAKSSEEKHCDDCDESFDGDKAFRQHMHSKHSSVSELYYCSLCNVHLKNESALKSHNSKLHLERRNKIYYCRECEKMKIFHCKKKHQEHIKEHYDEMCKYNLQCNTCGKLFSQMGQYMKHLETHDDDFLDPCDCKICKEETKNLKRSASDDSSDAQNNKKLKSEEQDGDNLFDLGVCDLNVKCGFCSISFDSMNGLEHHIESEHSVSQEKESITWPCTLCGDVYKTYNTLKTHRLRNECRKKSHDLMVSSRASKLAAKMKKKVQDGKSVAVRPRTMDIISRMKEEFIGCIPGLEDEDEEMDEFQVMGFKNIKSRPLQPRTLSESSRASRKRLEYLTKLAQDVMKKREEKRKLRLEQQKAASQESKDVTVVDDEEENIGLSGRDDLLIPLPNDWVCEKIRDGSSSTGYITNYWSPNGDKFSSLEDVEAFSLEEQLNLDIDLFRKSCLEPDQVKSKRVRVRDNETGLPLVIVFTGENTLTMNESATAND